MGGDPSAYAVLGLQPGADRAAIEQAYKKLIKQHHPDREGGDARRAVEIIRAYRELRGGPARDPLEFNDEEFAVPRRAARWPWAALVVAGGAAVGVLAARPLPSLVPQAAQLSFGSIQRAVTGSEIMEQPLHVTEIDLAARQALHLTRTSDEMAMAEISRDCQRSFHDNPALKLLDRCAAFDDAVAELQDRDPLGDGGPFAPLAVTGRQWSAATGLSNDYLAIDSRLDQIRLRVELALAPHVEPVAPAVHAEPVPKPIEEMPPSNQRDASAAADPVDCTAAVGGLPSGC